MSEDNLQVIMRAIGRLEGKLEDVLAHQVAYNSRLEKLDGKIATHERTTREDIAKHRKECDVKGEKLDVRIKKNETVIAKFLGIVAIVGFIVSLTFNAIWNWITTRGI